MIAWMLLGVSAVKCALQGGLLWRNLGSQSTARLKRIAVRLHAQNWTHGQIPEELGRHPHEVVEWLAEAERAWAL